MDLNEVIKQLTAERDAAMREASELAMCIWRSEFRNESPEFELCDSPAGIISQIDNMFAGIRQQRDAFAAQVEALEKWRKLALQFDGQRMQAMGLLKMIATGHFDMRVIRKFVADAPVSGDAYLAEIKADVVEKYYYMGWEHSLSTKAKDGDHYGCGKRLAKEFADQVRQGE